MTPQLVLKKAAELISENGLAKGKYYSNGKMCTSAAIEIAAETRYPDGVYKRDQEFLFNFTDSYAMHHLVDVIGIKAEYKCIAKWNDAPERTEKEVIAALIKASKVEELSDELKKRIEQELGH